MFSGCIVYGNIIYTIGSILIAAAAEVRSYKFMIVGRVVAAFGDIATQVAQYKIFSSWFPPSHGFASTLGFELGIKKVTSSSTRHVNMVTDQHRLEALWASLQPTSLQR